MSEAEKEKAPEVSEQKEVKAENNTQTQSGESIIKYKYEILSEDYTNFDLSFKLIVIGNSGVGKSSLTNNGIKKIFNETYNATVGFEFFTFNVKMNDKVVKLQIWDTCGQELYRSLITNFYRNTSLAVMVYAINSKETFDDIDMWLRELRTHSNPDAKVFLIGNKVDLENEREVKREQGEEFSKMNKINFFTESSAKTGLNAQNVFIKAAKLLLDNFNQYEDRKRKEGDIESDELSNEPAPPQKLQGTKNNSNTNKGKEKKKCC
jgi:small GTP-binding protein